MAVKIVAHNCALSSLAEVLRESALSTSIQHPNVVSNLPITIDSSILQHWSVVSGAWHAVITDLCCRMLESYYPLS